MNGSTEDSFLPADATRSLLVVSATGVLRDLPYRHALLTAGDRPDQRYINIVTRAAVELFQLQHQAIFARSREFNLNEIDGLLPYLAAGKNVLSSEQLIGKDIWAWAFIPEREARTAQIERKRCGA